MLSAPRITSLPCSPQPGPVASESVLVSALGLYTSNSIFTEHLLCVRHCSRCRGHSELNKNFCPHRAYIRVQEALNKQDPSDCDAYNRQKSKRWDFLERVEEYFRLGTKIRENCRQVSRKSQTKMMTKRKSFVQTHVNVLGKGIPGRGTSKGKGPEAGAYLQGFENVGISEIKADWMKGRR